MKILPYDEKYKNEVIKLHQKALDEVRARVKDKAWEEDLYNIKNVYFKNNGIFLIALIDKKLVAMGGLKVINKDEGEICRMRVDPLLQNRKIGSEIIKNLHKHANEIKLNSLTLSTTTIQKQAISFYKKHGYKEYKRTKEYGFNVIYFRKNL